MFSQVIVDVSVLILGQSAPKIGFWLSQTTFAVVSYSANSNRFPDELEGK
jgi:hypothetical protein